MSRGIVIVASWVLLGLSTISPSSAQGPYEGWQFDSIAPPDQLAAARQTEAGQVYAMIMRMVDAWNNHNIEGFLDAYWHSPDLLVVVDSEQTNGWNELYRAYVSGYPDRSTMGFFEMPRVQIKMLKPDLALVLTWVNVTLGHPSRKVVGTSTMTVARFDDGWKIIVSHSNFVDL